MAKTENLRERIEELERENRSLTAELASATAERESWDFESPETAMRKLSDLMRTSWERSSRSKMTERFRMISSAFDTWAKLFRLEHDTVEAQKLREEIEELRTMIEAQSGRVIPLRGAANGE